MKLTKDDKQILMIKKSMKKAFNVDYSIKESEEALNNMQRFNKLVRDINQEKF
jgi:hypothetical protein